MYCSNCGKEIDEHAKFCSHCGAEAGKTKAQGKPTVFRGIGSLASSAQKAVSGIDIKAVGSKAAEAGNIVAGKASEVRDAAISMKEDIHEKRTELDRMLEQEVTSYNDAYTLMNDKGLQLYIERSRAVDLIGFVKDLVDSIANHPKSFDTEFEEIRKDQEKFTDASEYAERELQAARAAATNAGAGIAAGASVAFMAPTAAMWIATTFGTASTGAAISTLSGAAATNAALAWLGGGAVAAGGSGMAGGSALLALAGPVGWTIAGAALLSSILIFRKKRMKLNQEKDEEIQKVKKNTETIREMDARIAELLARTTKVRSGLNDIYRSSISTYGRDYMQLNEEQKRGLGVLITNTRTLSRMFEETIE